jgi:tetratricopeptide (TPR) repeat protein
VLKALLAQVLPKGRKTRSPAVSADATPLQRALALAAEKQWEEAARLTEELLAAQPEDVDAMLLQAKTFRARGLLEQAQQAYRRALVLQPRRVEAWLDLGVCHYLAGDHFWARVYYRFAAALDPENADVCNELAVVDIAVGNFGKAEEALEKAVARNPALPEAWNNLGLVLARRGELATARRHFLRAVFLRPDYYTAHCNVGLAAKDLELLDDAERALRHAVHIDPGPYTAWLNLGSVLQDAGKLEEALAALEAARQRAPDAPDVLAALSALWLRRADAAQAQALAERALEREPQHPQARLALAHAQLAQGNFAQGWSNYEARQHGSTPVVRRYQLPAWRGESLSGKSVLVWGEQGLGDEIMFASCLPDLLASPARCTLDCSPRLRSLFARSFPQLRVADNVTDGIDCTMPIGSLPLLFRESADAFPEHQGYLRPDRGRVAAWREQLAALGDGLKIGLAWRGGLLRTGQRQRSLELGELAQLFSIPNVRWVRLQHGDTAAELGHVREAYGASIASWDEALADLDETAALIGALDLVITVCSTVVHLSGAIGRPTWVLTPSAPAWRYQLAGTRMPWYPSVALYRQTVPGDWCDPVQRVEADLRCLAG